MHFSIRQRVYSESTIRQQLHSFFTTRIYSGVLDNPLEISDYSQTLSEPEKEEVEEEEDDNVQVIFSQIEPYQEELLAEDGSTAEGNKVKSSLFEGCPILVKFI